ncbi:hypothetical protein EST38_g13287 [Candolleomyces aberdarensis]|uniref:Uncharacterized protein n=1 Tax=Candolleomyces aberdarensis TaxID=2316362 RepID=A0A4Q2D0B7_9AGAR|nr:hypothetical protein EST38_g13287 [Candolleomyces aberdarensis]
MQADALRSFDEAWKARSARKAKYEAGYDADEDADDDEVDNPEYNMHEYSKMTAFLEDLTATEYMLVVHASTLDAAASTIARKIPGGVYTIRTGHNQDSREQDWVTEIRDAIVDDDPVTPAPPEDVPWSLDLRDIDLSSVVKVFRETWSNQVVVPWLWEDVEEIQTSFQIPEEERNTSLRRYFEDFSTTGSLRVFSAPTLFCDSKGNIVFWYIPGAFSHHSQEHMINAAYLDPQYDYCWDLTQGDEVKVSLTSYDPVRQKAGPTDLPFDEQGQRLLTAFGRTNRILACWLSLVHPTLFDQQMELHEVLYSEKCERMLSHPGFIYDSYGDWTILYPGFMLSGNQALSPRRDEADIHVFHGLFAFGTHSGGRVKIPSLGAAFDFEPGCAIFFPAAAMRYSVEAALSGQRAVIKTYCDPQLGWKAVGPQYARRLRHPTLDSIDKQFEPHHLTPGTKRELIVSGDFSIVNYDDL